MTVKHRVTCEVMHVDGQLCKNPAAYIVPVDGFGRIRICDYHAPAWDRAVDPPQKPGAGE